MKHRPATCSFSPSIPQPVSVSGGAISKSTCYSFTLRLTDMGSVSHFYEFKTTDKGRLNLNIL